MTWILRRARRLRGGAIASLVTLAACRTSPAPRVVAVADLQRGASVTLRLTDGAIHRGELLAVRDSSLMVLAGARVATALLSDVESIDFGDDRPVRLREASTGSSRILDRARSEARFPYGITPRAMALLLESTGQDAPIVLRPLTP